MDNHLNEINRVGLIYFSGTGGTKRVAEAFAKELKGRGLTVTVKNLGMSLQEKKDAAGEQELREMDLNLLIYPVYAMDAPRPVYEWIGSVTGQETGCKIAVLSVSGGGEMWPNKGCRNSCCKALENKGFEVVYDRMLVMPANVLVEYDDHLAMRLLNAVPIKAAQIVDDLIEGKIRRTRFGKGPVLRWISRSERENSGKFPQGFEITDACTSCGWCVRNCPTENIKITESGGKPSFSDRCVICTRCIYGCPGKAMKAKGPLALKHGFDLEAVEQRMKGVTLKPVKQCTKGWMLKGVRDYLMDRY
jgi:ferredoxin/flavodoxin